MTVYDDHSIYDTHTTYDPGASPSGPFIPHDFNPDQFSYYFFELMSNKLKAVMPMRGVRFSSKFKDIGTFDGYLSLGDDRVVKLSPLDATIPERTAVYVGFGSLLVWGGIIWGRSYDSSNKQLKVVAEEFGSYYERQYLDTTMVFNPPVEQLEIARQIVIDAQQAKGPYSDISMGASGNNSGKKRKRTYHGYEFKEVWDALKQLSNVINGFDFAFDVTWGENFQPIKTLTLSYPRRGRTAEDTKLLLDYPGNIATYQFPEDSSNNVTKTTAIGSGEGDSMLKSTATNQTYLNAGYPQTETTYSYKDIIEQDTLDDHANADLEFVSDRFEGMTIQLPVLGVPRFGDYIIGDEALIRIHDERFPNGITGYDNQPLSPTGDAHLRIIGWEVSPEDNTVNLELASQVAR